MSGWEIGSHDSPELISLRKQLSEKDSQYANMQTQLLKRTQEFEEMKRAFDGSVQKLHAEAERALAFEKTLLQCNENLHAERVARQNAEISIATIQEKINLKEKEAKELQAIIDSLSYGADDSRQLLSKLQLEKSKLENQVKELQANLREVTLTPAPARRAPRRTNSLSDTHHIFLEQELNELRSTYTKIEAELRATKEELQRTQANLCSAQNERTVVEKRLKGRVLELESALELQTDEYSSLKSQTGDDSAAQREEDLLFRIEQEEAKALELNKMVDNLESEKRSLRKKAEVEATRAAEFESRNVELVSEREQALDELYETKAELKAALETVLEHERCIGNLTARESDLRQQIERLQTVVRPQSVLSQCEDNARPECEDPNVVSHVERLLLAVERIRGERDGLRRDLEYLQMESSITIETLEKKLFAALEGPQDNTAIIELQEDIRVLRSRLAESRVLESKVNELQGRINDLSGHNNEITSQLDEARRSLQEQMLLSQEKDQILADIKASMEEAQSRLAPALAELQDVRGEREQLRHRLGQLQDEMDALTLELASTKRELSQTELNLEETLKSLEGVESQRESLTTEVTNLQNDLAAAQQELDDAEQRNDTLQAKQLATFSSYEATKALREQIEVLEQRVQRRTEQIGIHQHDIKRLEVNLRLQEDRANEMTAELDEMARQKEAMVEDCAAAREARDEALMRVEAMELELEAAESRAARGEVAREAECAALVDIWAEAMNRLKSMQALAREAARRRAPDSERMEVDDGRAAHELNELRGAHQACLEELEEKNASLEALQISSSTTSEDLYLVTVALASAKAELSASSESTAALRTELAALQDYSKALEDEVQSKTREISVLSNEQQQAEHRSAEAITQHEALVEAKFRLEQQVNELRQTIADTDVRHNEEVEALVRARNETESRMAEVLSKSQSNDCFREQLESLRSAHSTELSGLQDQLTAALKNCEETHQLRDSLESQLRELEQLHEQTKTQLVTAEARLDEQLSELEAKHAEELSYAKANLQQEIDHLRELIDETEAARTQASDEICRLEQTHSIEKRDLQGQLANLEANIERLEQECETSKQQLQQALQSQQVSTAEHAETQKLLAENQAQLQAAVDELDSLREKKDALGMELKKSALQIENAVNVRTFLEDELKDSKIAVSNLQEELKRLKAAFIQSEKAEKTAEMKLSLQSTQNEHTISSLKREIERLKSRPDFEAEAIELRERIEEMDQLLRSKSAEIEENDDKFIELLKEKKKLATKIETLTRKVQSLQTKVSAVKTASSTPDLAKPVFSRPSPVAAAVPPVPPLPSYVAGVASFGTPSSRSRTISGPSSLPRPKTPEPKAAVFSAPRLKTPERRNPFQQEPSEGPSSVAGKKRSVPEDFDDCEGIPPQGIVAERLMTFGEENMTPRSRRPFQNARTGFTPQRTLASKLTPKQASPIRRMTTGDTAPIISDVTNSPRGAPRVSSSVVSKSLKSGWLGKIRGNPSQAGSRGFSSRPPLGDAYGPS